MRAVIQRVQEAEVMVGTQRVGRIDHGLLVLLGVECGDSEDDLRFMRRKIPNLRIFEDDQSKMNRSVLEVGGAVLMVSQFTLLGDARKGNRPSFSRAAPPSEADRLYTRLIEELRGEGVSVESGVFQAMMKVSLINDGPVTIILDSRRDRE
jgi:D-tyrosyl-tRNA(Tyr) deacylase